MHPSQIPISDFDYYLPEEQIATHPVETRDQSKLLIFRNEKIDDVYFHDLEHALDADTILIGNNTRVIPARLFFKKETGATIEIFCLEPASKSHQDAMLDKNTSIWKCLVGGAKKWKGDEVLNLSLKENVVTAKKLSKNEDQFSIEFQWNDGRICFSEILDAAGELPLPPYFNRSTEESDYHRYQTVFASMKGSVAAPTAGLHFTESLIQRLEARGINKLELTLHVGAGTFKPVSSTTMDGHTMHSEKFSVSTELLQFLIQNHGKKIVTIGTTTTRALESLYWLGVKMMQGKDTSAGVEQWEPYDQSTDTHPLEVLKFLYHSAVSAGQNQIQTETTILIAPGYTFKFVHGLITNFHMPKSTLLLLVAAVTGQKIETGEYHWRGIYAHALAHNYRFLSYGDSSLLFVNQEDQSR